MLKLGVTMKEHHILKDVATIWLKSYYHYFYF